MRQATRNLAAACCVMAVAGCQGHMDVPVDAAPLPPGPAQVTVNATVLPPGADLPIHATGLQPDRTYRIGIGQPDSEYSVVRQARADARGELDMRVAIPDWAMRGHPYVVVVVVDELEPLAVSEPFMVGSPGDRVTLPGTMTDEGVECPAMRGPGGMLYALVGIAADHPAGTEVTVEGRLAEAAICMQGTTIQVESLRVR